MADTALRSRSISEIVDAAFSLYRRDFLQYFMVGAIAYSPLILITILTQGLSGLGASFTVMAMAFGAILAFTLVSGVIARMGSDVYLGGHANAMDTVSKVLPRVLALIGAMLVSYLIIGVGFVLLLVPGLYFAIRLCAVPQTVVLEGKAPMEAISRSWALTKGRAGHVFGTLLLVYGIFYVLTLGLTLVTALAGNVVLQTIINSLIGMFCYPLLTLVSLVLYYDLRIRGEGFDVEHMSQSLGTHGYGAPMGSPGL